MATTINNEATAVYSIGGSASQSITSNSIPVALQSSTNISVTKTANPTTFVAGSIITYTVVITNTGPNYLTGVRIIDNLGGGNLAYVLGSATLSSTTTYPVNPVATQPLTFTLQELSVGQSMTLTYKCQVMFNLPSSIETITNSLQAIGYTTTTSYSAYASSTIEKKTTDEFSITKSVSVPSVFPSQIFNYIITMTNGTNETINIISLTDNLPDNFVLQSVSLKIDNQPTTTLNATDYILQSGNTLVVPSLSGPSITVPADANTIVTLTGYFN